MHEAAGLPVSWTLAAVCAAASFALARWLTPRLAGLMREKGIVARNYAGRSVPQSVGLAILSAAWPVYGLMLWRFPAAGPDVFSLLLAGTLMALAGFLDDVAGGREPKGWRGHLGALRRGRLTAGAVKAGAAALAGVLAAAAPPAGGPWHQEWAARVTAFLLIGLMANTVNALDLRPGRAMKVFLLVALGHMAATGGAVHLAPLAGAGAGYLRQDLRGQAMMGDAGANLLGAVLGAVFVRTLPPAALALALGLLLAFQWLIERRSLSAIIEANPLLRRADCWGRPTAGR